MTTAAPATSGSNRPGVTRFVAAGVILLGLVAGGWYLSSNRIPRPENAADFRPDPGGRRGGFFMGNGQRGRANVTLTPREPVSIAPRVVTVRDGDFTLSCSRRNDGNWNINITFNGESLATREQQQLLRAVRRTVDSRQPPASLKLTDAQRAALASIPLAPPELNAEQFAQLDTLLNHSQALTANAPEMTEAKRSLAEMAARIKTLDREAVKAVYTEREAKVRSILSPEQVNSLLGPAPNRAAPANPG